MSFWENGGNSVKTGKAYPRIEYDKKKLESEKDRNDNDFWFT